MVDHLTCLAVSPYDARKCCGSSYFLTSRTTMTMIARAATRQVGSSICSIQSLSLELDDSVKVVLSGASVRKIIVPFGPGEGESEVER